jgi:hypothetical protein
MNLSTFERVLWVAGFVGQLGLLAVLLVRRRWKEFPVFTALMAFESALTAVLFLVYRIAPAQWYAPVYWSYAAVDFLLQVALVLEIARVVLRPTGTWIRDAKRQFLFMGACGILVAAILAWIVSPPTSGRLETLEVGANLFTSLVTCELFVVMSLTANRLGLAWRSHVMAVAQGLTAWASVAVLIDASHSYFGQVRGFLGLEHVKMLAYLATLVFWMIQLWRDEPVRQPISPRLQQYILDLNQRVQYDLRKSSIES